MPSYTTPAKIFLECVAAIRNGILIHRESRSDKEFHFQNWFADRLEAGQLAVLPAKRNSYPDFRLAAENEGYEIKGLESPGRDASYDANSQAPGGRTKDGRTIYYVFGRYPAKAERSDYPVLDLVICHGDFLNTDYEYVHKNQSIRTFGSFGDIMIRDRKMYVPKTPYALAAGLASECTLILPADFPGDHRLVEVGRLKRTETTNRLVGYSADIELNTLTPVTKPLNRKPQTYEFLALRPVEARGSDVSLISPSAAAAIDDESDVE